MVTIAVTAERDGEPPVAVSPLNPGSVCVTVNSTVMGSSRPITSSP